MCDWKPDESDQDVDQNNLLVTDWNYKSFFVIKNNLLQLVNLLIGIEC